MAQKTEENAPAQSPAMADELQALRGMIAKDGSAAKVVDSAMEWIATAVSRINGPGSGTRAVCAFRIQRPSGMLKSLRVMMGGAAASSEITVERPGLARGGAHESSIVVFEGENHPIVNAFNKALGQKYKIACAPITNSEGTWGCYMVACTEEDMDVAAVSRPLRVVTRVINEQLARQAGSIVKSVSENNPRTVIDTNALLGQLDLLLACSADTKSTVAVLAFSLSVRPGGDVNNVRRLIRQSARAVLASTRPMDVASILGDDAIIVVLPKADESVCKVVEARIRKRLRETLPAAAGGGFSFSVLSSASAASVELFTAIAAKARAGSAPV